MIVNDVLTCVARKQTPVILTKFKEHAKFLYDALKGKADHVFLLYGDNSDKENAEIRVRLKQVPENESLILVATGQKIGEGFDFPRLDVLMLAAPVSFEGRLEQYVGRLNRDYPGKEAVYVYDYIDSHVRFFDKMYAKRLRTDYSGPAAHPGRSLAQLDRASAHLIQSAFQHMPIADQSIY